jgi:hypothetical protein
VWSAAWSIGNKMHCHASNCNGMPTERHFACCPKWRQAVGSIAYASRGVWYASSCVPPLWVVCKVVLSGHANTWVFSIGAMQQMTLAACMTFKYLNVHWAPLCMLLKVEASSWKHSLMLQGVYDLLQTVCHVTVACSYCMVATACSYCM